MRSFRFIKETCEHFFSPPLMNSLVVFTNNENVRNFQILSTDLRKTVIIMDLKVIYRASTNWAKLTSKYKLAISLEEFKIKIKTPKYYICPCRLGKKFQPNLGFVDQGV